MRKANLIMLVELVHLILWSTERYGRPVRSMGRITHVANLDYGLD